MESILSDFRIDWQSLIAQVVNFSIVVAILYFFIFKPLIKTMTSRSQKIEEGLENAKNSEAKLNIAKEESEKMLKNAKQEANKLILEANEKIEAEKRDTLAKTKEQLSELAKQEKENIEAQKKQMLSELELEARSMAVSLSEKILDKELDLKTDSDFIKRLS